MTQKLLAWTQSAAHRKAQMVLSYTRKQRPTHLLTWLTPLPDSPDLLSGSQKERGHADGRNEEQEGDRYGEGCRKLDHTDFREILIHYAISMSPAIDKREH